jgi:hypothetical protein
MDGKFGGPKDDCLIAALTLIAPFPSGNAQQSEDPMMNKIAQRGH